jgi:2-polyprenyl-6-methoxyphenol hydroxylase-like FAD-dependent oxidoreductase
MNFIKDKNWTLSMSSHLPVLIVGAGPTGLMMACELARHGIAFRIIDKKSERSLTSNATWIQTRTIELLDQAGLAPRFLKVGHPCNAINLYIEGKPLVTIPLNGIDSTYPFILMLPQSETERLLIERLEELKHPVEWSSELIDIKQEGRTVISTVRLPKGKMETITSDWLIACDGANSTVREKCRIFFPGEDLTEQFVVADAHINSFTSKDEIHLFFDQGTLFAASPLGGKKYRIAANLHLDYPRQTFYEQEVIELVQERGHGAYYVTNVSWISPFWIHGKIAEQMRQQSIFLMGDAAHIHSPLGGQGMNTGLQDAYNLAWKLALIIKGKAKSILLDSYQAERHPVVREIVNQTEKFTKMALFDKSFLTNLRKISHQILQGEEEFIKETCAMISQVGIRYQDSPVINYEECIKSISPRQGDRAPDVVIDQSTRLYDYLRNPFHNILLFTGSSEKNLVLSHIKQLQEWLNQLHPDLIKTHVVTNEKLNDIDNIIYDPDDVIHKCYQINKPVLLIIRPDNYIAYCSEKFEYIFIERFFQQYLYSGLS